MQQNVGQNLTSNRQFLLFEVKSRSPNPPGRFHSPKNEGFVGVAQRVRTRPTNHFRSFQTLGQPLFAAPTRE